MSKQSFISLTHSSEEAADLLKQALAYSRGWNVHQDKQKAAECMTAAAKLGEEYAVAYTVYHGLGVPKNTKKALQLLHTAADTHDHAQAQYMLATHYAPSTVHIHDRHKQRVKDSDIKRSLHYYSAAAEHSQPEACFTLGYIYLYGCYGQQLDAVKGFQLLLRASRQGHIQAHFQLGVCFEHGSGTEANHKRAMEHYSIACNAGYAHAQFNLGIYYYKGVHVAQDLKRAVQLWSYAAAQDEKDALYNLGYCYYLGNGVAQVDHKKAFELWSLAAEPSDAGVHTDAAFQVAKLLLVGEAEIERNLRKAMQMLKLCADHGHVEGMLLLADTYNQLNKTETNDTTIERNNRQIYEYLLRAASPPHNHSLAQYRLAEYIDAQLGDYTRSLSYYLQSAAQGNPRAQFAVGYAMECGQGCPAEPERAFMSYTHAAEQGDIEAMVTLGKCYTTGRCGARVDLSLAFNWFKTAVDESEEKDGEALFYLATCYEQGAGVKSAATRAKYYFMKSALLGHEPAIEHLTSRGHSLADLREEFSKLHLTESTPSKRIKSPAAAATHMTQPTPKPTRASRMPMQTPIRTQQHDSDDDSSETDPDSSSGDEDARSMWKQNTTSQNAPSAATTTTRTVARNNAIHAPPAQPQPSLLPLSSTPPALSPSPPVGNVSAFAAPPASSLVNSTSADLLSFHTLAVSFEPVEQSSSTSPPLPALDTLTVSTTTSPVNLASPLSDTASTASDTRSITQYNVLDDF